MVSGSGGSGRGGSELGGSDNDGVDGDHALPVAVVGPRHVTTQVTAWVESRLGWQVTTGGELPPVVRLVAVGGEMIDAQAPGRHRRLPAVALVGPEDDPLAAAMLSAVCDVVVAWPDGHDDLSAAVAQAIRVADLPTSVPAGRDVGNAQRIDRDGVGAVGARSATALPLDAPNGRPLVVGGASGGVGTTTVAITLAAWHVWRRTGGQALAVVSGPVPVADARMVASEVLAGHRGWAAATDVPDVTGLRVVRSASPTTRVVSPEGVALIVDVGVVAPTDEEVDVLVARRDAAGLAAVRDTSCGSVVIADDGPVPRDRVVAAAAGRHVVVVPWSVRVARAHVLGRVPGSLPGNHTAAVGRMVVA